MARGKYGLASARRRAASAEDQLDRLTPRLVDAERDRDAYRRLADEVEPLRAELLNLRDRVGISQEEHEAALDAVRQERNEHDAALVADLLVFTESLKKLIGGIPKHYVHGEAITAAWMSSDLIRSMRRIPYRLASAIYDAMGLERTFRRQLLDDDRAAARARADGVADTSNLARYARELGEVSSWHEGIPHQWFDAFTSVGREDRDWKGEYLAEVHYIADRDPRPAHPLADLRRLYNAHANYVHMVLIPQLRAANQESV